jgi:ribosome-associated translation inhibitor RaiA
MQIDFSSRDPHASPLGPLAAQRLRFALKRLAWWVLRVRVHLDDDNGPRTGNDKRCRVQLKTRQGHELVLTEVADDFRTAFERALARLVRSLSSLHQRAATPTRLPRQRRVDLLGLSGLEEPVGANAAPSSYRT